MALSKFVQINEGQNFPCPSPSGLAVHLRDLDSDRRAKMEDAFLCFHVISPNPCVPAAGCMSNDMGLREAGQPHS